MKTMVYLSLDQVLPTITCPDDINSRATQQVTWLTPMAMDNYNTPTVECSPVSGFTFPVEQPTPVTCTATDDAGNVGTCMFIVTVGMYFIFVYF